MFDAQAWYARDVILGRRVLPNTEPETNLSRLQPYGQFRQRSCAPRFVRLAMPDRAEVEREWAHWRKAEDAIDDTDEARIRYQAEYVKRLHSMTDYPPFDVDAVVARTGGRVSLSERGGPLNIAVL